jgi:hypothetical protein
MKEEVEGMEGRMGNKNNFSIILTYNVLLSSSSSSSPPPPPICTIHFNT